MLLKEQQTISDSDLSITLNDQKVPLKKKPDENVSYFGLKGNVDITVLDSNGDVKQHIETHNRIVDTGLFMIASLIGGNDHTGEEVIQGPVAMAIGSEDTEVLASNTELVNEVFRKGFDSKIRANNNIEFTTTFLPNEPPVKRVRLAECGIFNNIEPEQGVMLNRCCYSTISKYQDDTLIIRWTITMVSKESEFDTVWEDETDLINDVSMKKPAP